MKGIRARVDYILKHNVLFNKAFKAIASTGIRLIGCFVRVDNFAILFSGHTRLYNDSPRAIYEYMISQPQFKNYTFYWALDNPSATTIPGKCEKVVPDTLKYFIIAQKCKYWITCVNIERGLKFKKKSTIYLNTWHGTPIKTVGNDAEGRKDYDFSHINYFCVAGEYEAEINKHAFNLSDANMIRTGFPRNDELYRVDLNKIKQIKSNLGITDDKKVILYAPTWRDSTDGGKSYAIEPPIHFEKWREQLGSEYTLLVRTHPYTNKLFGFKFDNFAIDVCDYPRINDLMMISDILISDYSGTIFDYTVLKRPIICFAYDYEEYKEERGIYLDLEKEMPNGICRNEEQVIEQILSIDFNAEKTKVDNFSKRFVNYGGSATKQCVDILFRK